MVDGVRAMPEFESVPEIIQAGKFLRNLRFTIYDLRVPFNYENGS
jgi:hypothetical protein